MPVVETGRVVIVGAGLGALYAALNLAPHPVLLISPENLGQGASSAWAQGGIAAAMTARQVRHGGKRMTAVHTGRSRLVWFAIIAGILTLVVAAIHALLGLAEAEQKKAA